MTLPDHSEIAKAPQHRGREIVFDTETTGFDARGEDRITEIGCIEVIDYMPTGARFHAYLNPQRDVPERVVEITGLTTEFLSDKPLFKDRAQEFLDFIGDSPLIAHNADFDRGFINAELERAGFVAIPTPRFIDTLKIARQKFPGSPATLDALCKRFEISLASRDKHGAITDSLLLAAVYLELSGGRARKLDIFSERKPAARADGRPAAKARPAPLTRALSEDVIAAHTRFIAEMGEGAIWNKYNRER